MLIIGAAVLFFCLINTSALWINNLDFYAMIASTFLFLVFIGLFITLSVQLFLSVKEQFQRRERNIVLGVLITILLLTFIMPFGLSNFKSFESKDVLIAQREGVANCTITLTLKENGEFVSSNICFGASETKGNYSMVGDTVLFEKVKPGRGTTDFYKFGILKLDQPSGFTLFRNAQDSIGLTLNIIKYEE